MCRRLRGQADLAQCLNLRFVDLALAFEEAIEDPEREVHCLWGDAFVIREPPRDLGPRLVVVFRAIEISMHRAISCERELRRRIVVTTARVASFFDNIQIAKTRSSGLYASV